MSAAAAAPHTSSSNSSAAGPAGAAGPDSVILQIWVIPEWREHYVPYAVLLSDITKLVNLVPEVQQISKNQFLMRRDKSHHRRGGAAETFDASLNQTFSGTQMSRTFAAFDNDEELGEHTFNDLAMTMQTRRDKALEEISRSGFQEPGSPGLASPGGFSHHDQRKSLTKHFRLYSEVVLTDELQLYIAYIEYRADRRLIQQNCTGFTPDGMECFPIFDALNTPCLDEDEHRQQAQQQTVHHFAQFLVQTIHDMNHIATSTIRPHVKQVVDFYTKKSRDVAGVTFALSELGSRLDTLHPRQRVKVERLFRRTHFTVKMLQEYCDHNRLIVTKLVEHFVQATHQSTRSLDALDHLVFFSHPHSGPLATLDRALVKQFADLFCDGNENEALDRIKLDQVSTRKKALTKPLLLLEVGLLAGMMFAFGCACIVLYSYAIDEYKDLKYSDSDLFMFSVSGILILLANLFAIDVVIWEYYEINFVFSLHLNPVKHFGGLQLLRDQLQYALLWVVILFCFVHAALEESIVGTEFLALNNSAAVLIAEVRNAALNQSDVSCSANMSALADQLIASSHPSRFIFYGHTTLYSWVWAYSVFPCLAVLYLVHWFLGRHKENWLSRTLWRILCTPFYPVEFPDFFVCEQLVSLSTTLFEVQFLWCTFNASDVESACRTARGDGYWVLLILPAVWRILQSLRRYHDEPFHRSFYPHLLNATKYLNNCIAYSFYALVNVSKFEDWHGAAKVSILTLFFVTFAGDMIFKCWYELWIEFGVLRWNAKHFLIRDEILLPQWTYYAAVAANVLLRALWIIKYFTEKVWTTGSRWTFPVFAVTEMIRRAVWNVYRVEHDQVSNIESYKVVKFAPTMHHEAPQKALWDVNTDHLKKSMPETLRTIEFFESSKSFFRSLSRQERMKLLKKLADADAILPKAVAAGSAATSAVPAEGGSDGASIIVDGSTSAAAASALRMSHEPLSPSPSREPFPALHLQSSASHHPHHAASSMYHVVPPSSAVSTNRGGIDLIRDPRTGVMKTPFMMFGEMFEEDRARALLLHMDGRSLDVYLNDLVESGDLERGYLDELNDAMLRPQRGASSILQRTTGPLTDSSSSGVAATGVAASDHSIRAPSRSISLVLRRGTLAGESTGIGPVAPTSGATHADVGHSESAISKRD